MKHTEKRWMDKRGDVYRGAYDPDAEDIAKNGLKRVTVTWDEPEYEDVEVVRWVVVNIIDRVEGFTAPSKKMCEDWLKNVREPDKLEFVKLTGTYRRRKPEPEAWEGKIYQTGLNMVVNLDTVSCDRTDLTGKKVRVEVVE